MEKPVILLGPLSTSEQLLAEAALKNAGYMVIQSENAELFRQHYPALAPAAFISWLECTQELLLETFAALPVGTGERIPFYQRVESGFAEWIRNFPIAGYFSSPISEPVIRSFIAGIERNLDLLSRQRALADERDLAQAEIEQLVAAGTALSSEHDLRQLLEVVLLNCRNAVCADAGSIYVRDRALPGGPLTNSLLFMVSQNDSIDTEQIVQYRLPVNAESIAGYVALSGKPVRIENVEQIPAGAPYKTSQTFKRYFEYRTQSMLAVPLINLQHEVVGVLQLINRKKNRRPLPISPLDYSDAIQEFSLHDERFVLSIAQLAAVSIERAQLYENVTGLFEGFLNASITSIDERDRVTSGHSRRVMRYALAFVDEAEKKPGHPFHVLAESPERRRQFQFAALLHDIGKIGVPEFVLTKEKRLPRDEMNILMANFDYIGFSFSVNPETVEWASREEIEADREFILRINKSGWISDEDEAHLAGLAKKSFIDYRGDTVSLLSAYAVEALGVKKGNLTAVERELIYSHAQSTHRILTMIPWTDALKNVPHIAAQHHERIDGTGYPQGIAGDKMFLESKILAVIDVYEALVAQDRPYKPRIPMKKALEILHLEVASGHLDGEVVQFFIENRIHLLYNQDEQEE